MILINPDKAIEIAKDKVRVFRTAEFAKNDIAVQNALLEGIDTSALLERRNYLRDLPVLCENKTVKELNTLLLELGI